MNKFVRLIALAPVLATGGAAADGFALGAKAGTLGLGVEGTTALSQNINLRVGINNYSYSFDETASNIRYNADVDLQSGGLIFDWHPFAGTFRLSAGWLYNKNAAHLTTTPTSNVTIGNNTYTPAQVGTLSGDLKFKKNAPYLGLGWGNAVAKGNPFGVTFEIGALFQGNPAVTLRSSNGAVSQADLQREAQDAEADLDSFKVYPVVSLGFSYRF